MSNGYLSYDECQNLAAIKERDKRKTMRVVAGNAKGRKILVQKGREVRPTTDRVREALFSAISPRIRDASVLDLFAGSGALGLESLSRGAEAATFVEKSRATAKLLSQNIRELGFEERSRVLLRDARRALPQLGEEGARFDLIFLDPPYRGPLLDWALEYLDNSPLLAPCGLIVAEHPADATLCIGHGFHVVSTKRYGTTVLSFVQRVETIQPS